MAVGDALGVQEVPVDTPVCFGTATHLKYFACFDREPSFFPPKKIMAGNLWVLGDWVEGLPSSPSSSPPSSKGFYHHQ